MSFFCHGKSEILNVAYCDVLKSIESDHEYDFSGKVSFLPLHRLNSRCEREESLAVIAEVIQTGRFTSGPYVDMLEKQLCTFYNAASCIATASGTDALKIALCAAGIGMGDEVILPVNSFAATENAVMAVGATPVFASIDESWNMPPQEVERLISHRTRAVLPVCLYGSTHHLANVHQVARKLDLSIIVDAAQCIGIPNLLDLCDAMVLSFNPFKNIGSMGKSGAILTHSPSLAGLARQFSYHGFIEDKKNIKAQDWGFNSRMDNMQAAILLTKFRYFERNATKRSFMAARYINSLRHLESKIQLPLEVEENSWHLFPIFLKCQRRNDFLVFAKGRNVELDIYYPFLSHHGKHDMAVNYKNREQFSEAERLHQGLVHLPLHNHMSLSEQDIVIEVLNEYFIH